MRVLCCTTPMEGVFGPFVPLGRALLAQGHEVIVATGPDLQARVRAEGFTAAVAGPGAMEGALVAMSDPAVAAAPEGEHWHFAGALFGTALAAAKLDALRELAHELDPDLIVHAPVDVAGPLVAAERELPSVAYGFAQPLEPEVVDAIAQRIAPFWHGAGLDPDPYAGIYRGRYLDPRPPSLYGRAVPTGSVDPIRPEIPGDPSAPLPSWASTLGDRPVVYVSLGTVPMFNQPDRFTNLLADLVDEDLDLVVTVSELNDPAALGTQPSNVHVERWLPLAPLLPRCDAVVCHGGSGTTLAALCAGLPLVLVPQGADQHLNAGACRQAGVAKVVDPRTAEPAAVRDAVVAVIEPGSTARRAAQGTAAEIASMPPAADVARTLEHLATSDSLG